MCSKFETSFTLVCFIVSICLLIGVITFINMVNAENTMDITIHVITKTIDSNGYYVIETDTGSYRTEWIEYSQIIVDKTYNVSVLNRNILEILDVIEIGGE